MKYRAEFFAAALVFGAALRVVAYPLPGSTDVPIFNAWSHYAATDGVGRLYGTGGRFPERRVLEYRGIRTKVDYPPLALYELRLASPKTLAFAGDALLAAILYVFARRRFGAGAPRRAVLAFWLNPAVILLGAVLGYLDVLYLAPAVAALLCALEGRAVLAGLLFAAACLTKPLAILVAPAIVVALPGARARRTVAVAAVAGAVLIVLPVIGAGGFLNMVWGVGSLVRDPFLSAAAANAWWLAAPLASHGSLDRLRIVGAAMTVLAIGWATLRAGRTPDACALTALAGFSIHAYAVLAVSVHENHLAGAIPFLALASATERRLGPVLATVSAIAAINMNVFYGLGVGVGWAVPRTIGRLDVMNLLAVANVATFVWHAAVASTRRASRARPLPV